MLPLNDGGRTRGKAYYNWPEGACEEEIRFRSSKQLANEPYDVIVVGAGVVGCALAYRLSRYDLSVLVVERLHDVGEGTSKANTALMHIGYDEQPGSLEARLVTAAARLWPSLAEKLKIPLDPIGGIVVATDDDQARLLEGIHATALANGADDVQVLSAAEVRDIEPLISPDVRGGLYVPRESIGDPFTASIAFAEVALANGVDFVFGVSIVGVEAGSGAVTDLHSSDGHRFRSRLVVNVTGLGSRRLADAYGGGPFDIHPRRGQFLLFDKSARAAVRHILLPVPTPKTKGVLVTPTVYGNLLAGPTAEDLPLDAPDATSTTIEGLQAVLAGGRRLYPGLAEQPIIGTYAGARCACDQGSYLIRYNDGRPGIVTVTGVRSTGFTGSITLGDHLIEGMVEHCGLELSNDSEAIDERPETSWPGWWRRPFEDRHRVAAQPDYGRMVCFCETISRGEIVDALDSPLRPRTLDALKRRTRAMMGRCQGFDCAVALSEIVSQHCGVPLERVTKRGPGSEVLSPAAQGCG